MHSSSLAPRLPDPACAGAVAQITVAVCGAAGSANRLYSQWYCERNSLAQKLITSVLPTILLVLWQNLVMPNALYRRGSQLLPSCRCASCRLCRPSLLMQLPFFLYMWE